MAHPLRGSLVAAALCAVLGGAAGCSADAPSAPAGPPAPTTAVTTTAEPVVVTVPPQAKPVGLPTRLLIPAIGVREQLHPVGLKADGAMQTPDFGDAGWYDVGPRPGAPGPAVLVAHVHGPGGDDVFARLHELKPGDTVTVRRTDGVATFVVETVERARKEALPYDRIWTDTDQPVLRLITCGGKPDPVTRVYPDNTIVYARLAP